MREGERAEEKAHNERGNTMGMCVDECRLIQQGWSVCVCIGLSTVMSWMGRYRGRRLLCCHYAIQGVVSTVCIYVYLLSFAFVPSLSISHSLPTSVWISSHLKSDQGYLISEIRFCFHLLFPCFISGTKRQYFFINLSYGKSLRLKMSHHLFIFQF